MEAAIIVEGFKCSEEMYGLQYHQLIADGDSSVYKKILEAKPYKDTGVQKIECKNHLLRNYCNKMKNLANSTSGRVKNLKRLKGILSRSYMRIRGAVEKAIIHRQKETSRNEAITGFAQGHNECTIPCAR